MPSPFDLFFQQQSQPQLDNLGMTPPPQASGGLFGNVFGDYDLGSRLMMAGSFLDGQPGAAMAMAQQMERRRLAKEVAKQRYEAAKTIIKNRPELAPLYNANPEQFMTYYTKMTFDEMLADREAKQRNQERIQKRADDLEDEARKWNHEKERDEQGHQWRLGESAAGAQNQLEKAKELAKFNQDNDPALQYHNSLLGTIMNQATKIQAPGAGIKGPGVSTLAARQVFGDPKMTQRDVTALMDPGAGVATSLNQVADNQRAQEGAKISEWQQALALGAIPPGTPYQAYLAMSGRGAAGGVHMTEAERRGKSLQSSVANARDFSDDDMKALAENSVKIRFRDSGIPGLNEMMQHYVAPEAQKADVKLRTLINTYVLAVSGSAFSQGEIASRIENMIPHSGDAPETVALKKQMIADMVATIDKAAQTGTTVDPIGAASQLGVTPRPGLPLPDLGSGSGFSTEDQERLKKYGISP